MKQAIGVFVVALVAVLALTWVLQGNDWFLYKVFAPKYEQVRRETFEESKAYNQGVVQELDRQFQEYNGATTQQQKDAIKFVVLHQVADYDIRKLPAYLREFVERLRATPAEAR